MDPRFRLLLITDLRLPAERHDRAVAAALAGGVTAVQVRGPGMGAGELLARARALSPVVREAGATLLVNDRLDVALAAGADGVHLKRSSLPVRDARRLLGEERVVGVSTHTSQEVEEAFSAGADYVVYGPVFATPSKEGILEPRGPEDYLRVAGGAAGPVLALGGIAPAILVRFGPGRVPGLAAIRSLVQAKDPEEAAREMRDWVEDREGET